jgi:hypothetical protein
MGATECGLNPQRAREREEFRKLHGYTEDAAQLYTMAAEGIAGTLDWKSLSPVNKLVWINLARKLDELKG